MLALPPLDHEPRLLVRANRAGVRCDRLEMNSAEVAAHEPEFDELGDRCRPYAAARASGTKLIPASAWRANESNSNSDAVPTAVPSTSTTKVTVSSGASLSAARASRASNLSLVSGPGAHGFRSSQVSRSAAMLNKTSRSSSVRVHSNAVGMSGIASTVTLTSAISTPIRRTLIGHSTIPAPRDPCLHAHRLDPVNPGSRLTGHIRSDLHAIRLLGTGC